MAAWEPGDESVAPFDLTTGDFKEESVPSELAQFFLRNQVTPVFQIDLKRFKNESFSGKGELLDSFEGVIPMWEAVVAVHNVGHYGLETVWTPKGGKAKREIFQISLTGKKWEKVFIEAEKRRKQDERDAAEHEAELERIKRGTGNVAVTGDPMQAGKAYMTDVLASVKSLGGGADDKFLITMMMENSKNMMTMMIESSRQQNAVMVAMIQNMGGNKSNGGAMEAIALLKAVKELDDGGSGGKDKSLIEDVVGAIAENAPTILSLFQKPELERSMDKNFRTVKKSMTELGVTHKAQTDPAFLQSLVKHLDDRLDPATTDQVLKGFINVKRPGSPAAPSGSIPLPAPATQPPSAPAPAGEGNPA